jgi:tetratricopeptide (TPR) repeat protein
MGLMRTLLVLALMFGSLAQSHAASDSATAMDANAYLDLGIEAYGGGDDRRAIDAISNALKGSLPDDRLSQALFYRGLAYRNRGQPAQAIADFTRALKRNTGLSDAELSETKRQLSLALREAGLSEKEAVVVPDDYASTALSKKSKSSPVSTGSVPRSSPAPMRDWSSVTLVAAPQPPQDVRPGSSVTLAAAPEPPQDVRPVSLGAAERLVIAEVGSPNEAYALSVRITSQHGDAFGGRKLRIEPAAANGGTIYRLSLGPYATNEERRAVCLAVGVSGYDCAAAPQ